MARFFTESAFTQQPKRIGSESHKAEKTDALNASVFSAFSISE